MRFKEYDLEMERYNPGHQEDAGVNPVESPIERWEKYQTDYLKTSEGAKKISELFQLTDEKKWDEVEKKSKEIHDAIDELSGLKSSEIFKHRGDGK
jgi:hypothetical protein